MKINNEFIKTLIKEADPTPDIWKKLIDIWFHHANGDIRDYYYAGEEEAKYFEEFLLKTYDEFFIENLARACLTSRTSFEEREEDACFIVMDGMSIREGVLFCRALEKNGFQINLDYDFSGIPSTTETFREKIKASVLRSKFEFAEINNPKQIRISGDEKLIWSFFPDVMLDKIQVGHTVISSLGNMYRTIEKIVLELLAKLNSHKIIITSDHGYLRSEAGLSFPVPDSKKKELRDIFGGNRYISMNEADASNLVREGYVVEFSGFYLVKSRYIWPVPGKFSIYLHGGLSLMECLIPVIEVIK